MYTSDNISQEKVKKTCWSKFMGYFGITGSTPSIEIKNDTSTMGYAGLQLMKGKVIVIDNEVDGTRNMIIKNKYVLAHTSDLSLTRFNPN